MARKNDLTNRPWTDYENHVLIQGYTQRMPVAEIMEALYGKRTKNAVQNRAAQFRLKGLIPSTNWGSRKNELPSTALCPHIRRKMPKFIGWDFSGDNLELPRAV